MKLLSDLCKNIDGPDYDFGRPQVPHADAVFCGALKVYSTHSFRRFLGMVEDAARLGYVSSPYSFSSVAKYMRNPQLTPILYRMIELSCLPLASVETVFGVDSTGFTTSRFGRYLRFKHGRDITYKTWVKAHACVGTTTNIITRIKLTEGTSSDYPYFKELVEETAKVFDVKEVVADKAYLSRDHLQFVTALGGTPYIPFKKNSKSLSEGSPTWNKMFHYFNTYRDDYMKHYHKRSNVETAFSMVKAKFGDAVRSKGEAAQFNEVLLKALCHNICVVNQEVYELGIASQFNLPSLA